MKKIRILTAILLLLFFVVVVPGVISNYLSLGYINETLELKEKKLQSGLTIHLSREIHAYVAGYLDQLDLIGRTAAQVQSGTRGGNPFSILKRTGAVDDYLQRDHNLRALFILNTHGKGPSGQPPVLPEEVLTDLKNGFDTAMNGQDYIGNHFYLDIFPDTVLTIAQPIRSESGDLIGVVEALLSLSPTLEMLPKPEEGMTAYVVDSEGKVVINGNRAAMMAPRDYSSVEIVKSFIQSPLATQTKRYLFTEGVEQMTALGTVAPVSTPDWGVVVQRDLHMALKEGWLSIKRALVVTGLTILFALLLGYLLAMLISSPLQALAEKTQEMAEGDFSVRVKPTGTQEIATLSNNFNDMAEQIKNYIDRLKIAAKENRDLFINSIQMISSAIDAKDPYTKGHSDRVRRYSLAIAKEMGLSAHEIEEINISALLHDVGKIGVDDRVLRKPSSLNDEEFRLIKSHPARGAAIMEKVPKLDRIIPGIRYHHENWGGGGYPDGISGERIPMIARIIAVADTFDAMTTERPYQKAMSYKYAAEKIRSMTGKRFAPNVVEAFLKTYERGELLDDKTDNVA